MVCDSRSRDLLARCHLQLQIGKRRIKLEKSFSERSRELQTLTDLCPVSSFAILYIANSLVLLRALGWNFPYRSQWSVSAYKKRCQVLD